MTLRSRSKFAVAVVASALAATLLIEAPLSPRLDAAEPLPPADGPREPRVAPIKGDDGLWQQSWFLPSFLDLKDDHAEARAKGRRFAVIFEQRGCIYCTKLHTEILSQAYINDYVRLNFNVVQLDLWGSREVTDFDGQKMPEKKLAERWGVMFTPTIVFFHENLAQAGGAWGPPLEVARLQAGLGADSVYDMLVWVRARIYEQDRNFQRFHIARITEREAHAAGAAPK